MARFYPGSVDVGILLPDCRELEYLQGQGELGAVLSITYGTI